MWRKAFSPSTLTAAAVVVVVVVVTGGAASDHTSLSMSDLTQEIAMSLKVNQLAILKGINESSSLCASRDRDYHLWKEEANQQLQAAEDSLRGMAEDAQARMHNMTEETRDSLRGMAEDAQSMMQAVEEAVQAQQQVVEARQQAVEEAVQAKQRTVEARQQAVEDAVQAQQQAVESVEVRQQAVEAQQLEVEARQQAVEEAVQAQEEAVEERMQTMKKTVQAQLRTLKAVEAVLFGIHNNVALLALQNNTEPSRCEQRNRRKVLYGATGTLYSSILHQNCWWRVVMPVGTRPLFHWELPEEDCGECDCGVMSLIEKSDGGAGYRTQVCYGELLDQHVMNRHKSNEFFVGILNSRHEGAISVHYQAVPIN